MVRKHQTRNLEIPGSMLRIARNDGAKFAPCPIRWQKGSRPRQQSAAASRAGGSM